MTDLTDKIYERNGYLASVARSNTGHRGRKFSFVIDEINSEMFEIRIDLKEAVSLPIKAIPVLQSALERFVELLNNKKEQ